MDLSERDGSGEAAGDGMVRHPWEQARARFFLGVLDRVHAVGASSRILDIGAGDAWLGHRMVARWPGSEVVAWDHAYTDDELVAFTGAGVTAVRQQPAGTFDLVMLLDVLEHVDDERALLQAAHAALAPGGRLLFSVPAWASLLSSHDSRMRHRRRYRPAAARSLLEHSGFLVLESGGLFHSLLAPRALSRAVQNKIGRGSLVPSSMWMKRGAMHTALSAALHIDTTVSSVAGRVLSRVGTELPGLSWWALCMRSEA